MVERPAAAHTASDEAVFRRARLRLTAWYVGILAIIVIGFSISLYVALAAVLQARQNEGPDLTPELIAERDTSDFALNQLRLILAGGSCILLAGAAAGAYFLAGKTLQPVEQALARQRRFAADASHELRTPLTVMRGTIDVTLQRERTTADYQQVLNEVGSEVGLMTRLVEQLLDLARAGVRPVAEGSRCDLHSILTDAVNATEDLAASHTSQVALAVSSPLWVWADCQSLYQVFLNLLSNAIMHTPAGTPVQIEARNSRDGVTVAVIDHGQGIAPEQRERVFEPFFRGETVCEGTGLGLALAWELVRAQRGTLAARDTPGGGATFTVRLRAA